ncbi:RNA-binding domain-containing protein [Paraclostridium bifermentans]|uniref:RNA-binding domain-containing protein n=1 Tax=Paraclostridium bifermentans TaxID=1490 RepID=UPI001FF49C2C|nr:RNA-binding domain-containing protein [Paraclostridium bifermentans]MCR1876274.1 putative DNA binding domain-containing protein [Paraclostridium bifermentans]UOW67229.1 putative DNA binding domain-containing protein [Paraclostridium bifermentans]
MNQTLSKIQSGESISVEFKQSQVNLNKDVFDTVCSFLNRHGGDIILGVDDDGSVIGINPDKIDKIKKEFVTQMNNPNKINPPFYLSIDEVNIESKKVLHIYVPESSQVHRCSNKIFDRNEDGDIDITNNTNLVAQLYARKQRNYTENRIYKAITIDDLRIDIIKRIRKLASNQKVNHPWQDMDDMELLRSAGLYLKDYQTGEEGFTLAAVLLLGKDEVITSVLPHYRTDAILRVDDKDRYDDRDDIRTNLIESYDRLMGFIEKHLKDKFYLEKDQRISLRNHIFREVISNILIHREYTNPFPAKLIIEEDKVITENSNKPHRYGYINPENFSPFPKNPIIAKVFKEIGWVDELGSGVRNIYKYSKLYSGNQPKLVEEDIFKIFIPVMPQAMPQAMPQVMPQGESRNSKILEFCNEPKSKNEILEFLGLKDRKNLMKNILQPLINNGELKLMIPDKPRSPKQKYYS